MNADVEKAVSLDELKSAEIKFAQLAWRKALSEEDGYSGASKLMTECFRDGFYAGVRTYWDRVDAMHTERVQATQALRDQETEIARLKDAVMRKEGELSTAWIRASSGEALLRECVENREGLAYETDLLARITAHLGATHD